MARETDADILSISSKLDATYDTVLRVDERIKVVLQRLDDHEDRLRQLESTTHFTRAVWILGAATIGALGGFLPRLFGL